MVKIPDKSSECLFSRNVEMVKLAHLIMHDIIYGIICMFT